MTQRDIAEPSRPPVSRRSTPLFGSPERRGELAAAFRGQGADYERLRPRYPEAAVLDIRAALPPGARTAADLGAGTGKLTRLLLGQGLDVTAVDPSASMLEQLTEQEAEDRNGVPAEEGAGEPTGRTAPDRSTPGHLRTLVGTAEASGLPDASVDLVTAAQAWHWFDAKAASTEVARILRPGGVLALVWNTLDVSIPWVHRYSRIMHAGDVQKDDFTPALAPPLHLVRRSVHRWTDPRPTRDLIDLARTRSYVIAASDAQRERVLANLDWYVHEHLGHAEGEVVGLPYRTDVFIVGRDGDETGTDARDRQPVAVLLVGLTGSGKTTLAQRIETELGCARLSVDEEVFRRNGRYGVDYPHETYPEREQPVIEDLQRRLPEILGQGNDVVLDAGLWTRAERDRWRALAVDAGARVLLVHLDVPHAELVRRLAERNLRADANALTVSPGALEDFIARFEPPADEENAVPGTDADAVLASIRRD